MKVICIMNQKGGSAKTTTAALMALSSPGRVLCIDCDPQGGLTKLLGAEKGPGLFDLIMGDDVVPVSIRGIDLIRADYRLDKIAYTMPPFEMAKVIKKFDYDIVIMDTPPALAGVSLSAALAADKIFIPVIIGETATGPARYTINTLKEIEKTGKIIIIGKQPKEGATGYMADLFTEFSESIEKNFAGIIPRTVTAQKAAAGHNKIPKAVSEAIGGIL